MWSWLRDWYNSQHKTSCHCLSALAVPSLYLPDEPTTLSNASHSLTDNHPTLVNNLSTAPSTSGPQHTALSFLMEHNYSFK
ncbi:hypothetical protein evm_008499 [Chilo suppressalis]|nr:hypothetical protein evm_008499 [Chilo suppressalis]